MQTERIEGRTTAIGAWAVVHGHEPVVYLAENAETISRALALDLVARLPASEVADASRLEEMRRALLEERWAHALIVWMEETGTTVDVYEGSPKVWTERELELEQATLEIRMAPLLS
ncbi:MAG: hypothetical protein M3290_06040 [Actinomycetota bacterium]|nr:hypothetical protein [Actinomycetota bacterium]